MNKEEKEMLIKEIKEKAKDKEILEAVKLENTMEDRFKMIEDLALETGLQQGIEQGIKQGIEQKTVELIMNMIVNNIDYDTISKITSKSIEEIKEIEKSIKD